MSDLYDGDPHYVEQEIASWGPSVYRVRGPKAPDYPYFDVGAANRKAERLDKEHEQEAS